MTEPDFPKSILVDANFLVALLDPTAEPDDRDRVTHFVLQAEKKKSKLILPMPAVAEYLVHAETAAIETLKILAKKAHIEVADFDLAAAFECALLDRGAVNMGDKRDGVNAAWQKVKIDRQVVAIGKARGARLVISGDGGVRSNAIRFAMDAMSIQDLPLPPDQKKLPLQLTLAPGKKRVPRKPPKTKAAPASAPIDGA